MKFAWCALLLCAGPIACVAQATPGDAMQLGRSSVSGQVLDVAEAAPIELVDVCVFQRHDLCTTTDAEGNFRLDRVPDNAELRISLQAPGFVHGLRLLHTGDGEEIALLATLLTTTAAVEAQRERLGIEAAADTGLVAFFAVDPQLLPVVNVRARLSSVAADGPYYFNAERQIDPELTVGTDASGYFYNVPAADHALVITEIAAVSNNICARELPGLGWGLDSAGTGHRVPVVADAMTFVVPVCGGESGNP